MKADNTIGSKIAAVINLVFNMGSLLRCHFEMHRDESETKLNQTVFGDLDKQAKLFQILRA